MIRLTRLNDRPLVVNAELIKFVEETPDTVITLRDNEKILVKEDADEVVSRVVEYARSVRWIPGL
jgi:flagellar protein FlbD